LLTAAEEVAELLDAGESTIVAVAMVRAALRLDADIGCVDGI
jgi:hypothetical protein